MSRQLIDFGNLTITNPAVVSDVITTKTAFGHTVDLIIYTPATIAGTVTVQISPIEAPAAGDWKPLYVDGADVTLPTGKAVVIPAAAFRALRLSTTVTAATTEVFRVMGQADLA